MSAAPIIDESAVIKSPASVLFRLKDSLAHALAKRDEIPAFDTDTPADKTLKLLERMMHGEDVGLPDIIGLRDIIVRSGKEMRTPINLVQV